MTDPSAYTYPSPLSVYNPCQPLPPLPTDRDPQDGKSLLNPPRTNPDGSSDRSSAYDRFVSPLENGRRGAFDVHVYHFQTSPEQTRYARELWERIRREFPELRIYTFWDKPVGPHPVAMFEVNLLTPEQFGAFVPWLAIWRGPLSVLVHPNTVASEDDGGEEEMMSEGQREARNHTQRAIWMGERIPLNTAMFKQMDS